MGGVIDDVLSQREQARKVAESLLANATTVDGIIKCDGPTIDGSDDDIVETEETVIFPVEFTAMPMPDLNAFLSADSTKISGMLPIISVMGTEWLTVTRLVATHYVGMKVGVVVQGPIGTKVDVHWSVTGTAYVGAMPDGSSG